MPGWGGRAPAAPRLPGTSAAGVSTEKALEAELPYMAVQGL